MILCQVNTNNKLPVYCNIPLIPSLLLHLTIGCAAFSYRSAKTPWSFEPEENPRIATTTTTIKVRVASCHRLIVFCLSSAASSQCAFVRILVQLVGLYSVHRRLWENVNKSGRSATVSTPNFNRRWLFSTPICFVNRRLIWFFWGPWENWTFKYGMWVLNVMQEHVYLICWIFSIGYYNIDFIKGIRDLLENTYPIR